MLMMFISGRIWVFYAPCAEIACIRVNFTYYVTIGIKLIIAINHSVPMPVHTHTDMEKAGYSE